MSKFITKLAGTAMLSTLFFAQTAHATDFPIGGLKIESFSIVSAWGGHQPGNLELKIKGGFSIPEELTCTDTNYITTKNTVAGFDHIVAASMAAAMADKTIVLGLTDDPALTGFPTRCSVKFIVVQN